MYSRQVEQLARQRNAELAARTKRPAVLPRRSSSLLKHASQPKYTGRLKHTGQRLRSNTGWVIVTIGLRIAASGGKRSPVPACHPR